MLWHLFALPSLNISVGGYYIQLLYVGPGGKVRSQYEIYTMNQINEEEGQQV